MNKVEEFSPFRFQGEFWFYSVKLQHPSKEILSSAMRKQIMI
jgi:hypothetical protein